MFLNVLYSCWYLHSLSFPQSLFPSLSLSQKKLLLWSFSLCLLLPLRPYRLFRLSPWRSLLRWSCRILLWLLWSLRRLYRTLLWLPLSPRRIYQSLLFPLSLPWSYPLSLPSSSFPALRSRPFSVWSSTPPASQSPVTLSYRQRPLPLSLFALPQSRSLSLRRPVLSAFPRSWSLPPACPPGWTRCCR